MALQEAILPRQYLCNNSDILSSVFSSETIYPLQVCSSITSHTITTETCRTHKKTKSTTKNKLVLKMEGREKIRFLQMFLLVLFKRFGGVRFWTYFCWGFLTWFCSRLSLGLTSFTFQGNPENAYSFVLFFDWIGSDSIGISSYLQLFICKGFQWLFTSSALNLNWNLWGKQYLFKPLSNFFFCSMLTLIP